MGPVSRPISSVTHHSELRVLLPLRALALAQLAQWTMDKNDGLMAFNRISWGYWWGYLMGIFDGDIGWGYLMEIFDGDMWWDITNIINGFCGNWWRGSYSLQRTWCCQGLILHICLAPHKTCWNIERIRVLSLWDSNVRVIQRGNQPNPGLC